MARWFGRIDRRPVHPEKRAPSDRSPSVTGWPRSFMSSGPRSVGSS